MWNDSSGLRPLALGVAAAASALSFPAIAKAGEDLSAATFQSSTDFRSFTGQLREYHAPSYDGPVRWSQNLSDVNLNVQVLSPFVFAGLFALGVAAAQSDGTPFRTRAMRVLAGGAVGLGASEGISRVGASHDDVIQIQTTVTGLEQGEEFDSPLSRMRGPFYQQLFTIPESNIQLSAHSGDAPFYQGQEIVVRFGIDSESRIVNWYAKAGGRD